MNPLLELLLVPSLESKLEIKTSLIDDFRVMVNFNSRLLDSGSIFGLDLGSTSFAEEFSSDSVSACLLRLNLHYFSGGE